MGVVDVAVLIPWFGRDPHREAALGWVSRRWVDVGYAPTLGIPDGDVWVKAEAVRNAIGDSTAPVLVVADADVWSDGVIEAINRVRDGAPWVIPHDLLYRLDQDSTARVLAGEDPDTGMGLAPFTVEIPGFAHPAVAGGGIVVMRRDVYDDCPLDPRFKGWGQEDEAWAAALRCLYGDAPRLDHPLWHLWHPPQPRKDRGTGSDESAALFKRYYQARRRPERMRALIAEGRGGPDVDIRGDRRDAFDFGVGAP